MAKIVRVIPVYTEVLADTETTVRALMRFSDEPYVFLLESAEGGEKWGRYSFLGFDPLTVWEVKGDEVHMRKSGRTIRTSHEGDPLGILGRILKSMRGAHVPGLPRFWGGAVGYLGYDMVRFMERVSYAAKPSLDLPDAVMMLTGPLLVFDNLRHTVLAVVPAQLDHGGSDPAEIYHRTVARLHCLCNRLKKPVEERAKHENPLTGALSIPESNMDREAFLGAVRTIKEYILSGEAIQVVLSQRFSMQARVDPVALYRALRFINPSPYLFFLKLRETVLVGSSPELMVRLADGTLHLRPIAGTRRRGRTEQEDRALADELLRDPKERAEHVMLVDLGRNDLGRVARSGTVQLRQFMEVERYSHVMHLVSHLEAELAQGKDCMDVIRAAFPAGTLTGAPKVRAMEIIEELEPTRRGPYGGAVGYLGYTGNMDLCITIRTLLLHQGRIYVQAGAGIVADSAPEAEYLETCNKAKAMWEAVGMAACGLEIPGPAGPEKDSSLEGIPLFHPGDNP